LTQCTGRHANSERGEVVRLRGDRHHADDRNDTCLVATSNRWAAVQRVHDGQEWRAQDGQEWRARLQAQQHEARAEDVDQHDDDRDGGASHRRANERADEAEEARALHLQADERAPEAEETAREAHARVSAVLAQADFCYVESQRGQVSSLCANVCKQRRARSAAEPHGSLLPPQR
jgi:hypothetical protein